MTVRTHLEDELALQIRAAKLPEFVREFVFAKPRRFRFDIAFLEQQLAVEIDGAIWIGGRHSRGAGIIKDCEKQALAVILGWRVLRVTAIQIRSGQALLWITLALQPTR